MIVLAIDTALNACQAAVIDGGRTLAVLSEPMERGHQERLAPMVAQVMAAAGLGFDALERVGVTTGPGSFTGLRVGLAFAKALALALDIPCVGIGGLRALAASAPPFDGSTAAVIDAKRGQVYLQLFGPAGGASEPEARAIEDAVARLSNIQGLRLVGSGAAVLSDKLDAEVVPLIAPDPVVIGRLAAASPATAAPPSPVYLRAPDARLPA